MTFGTAFNKIKKYWWLITVVTIGISVFFLPRVTVQNSIASISVGLNFNSENFPQEAEASLGYTESLTTFSLYLNQRFNAIENQYTIANKMDINPVYSAEKAFYDVINNGAGFVTLTMETPDEVGAQRFIEGVKEVYTDIVKEWNSQRTITYQITPQTDFQEVIATQSVPDQIKILPPFAGLLLGSLIALVMPSSKVNS